MECKFKNMKNMEIENQINVTNNFSALDFGES